MLTPFGPPMPEPPGPVPMEAQGFELVLEPPALPLLEQTARLTLLG